MQDRNPSSEIWTGKRLGVDGAKQMLGFKSVYKGIDLHEFGLNWSTLNEVMAIFPDQPNHSRLANAELGDLVDYFQEATKKSKVEVNESGLDPLMAKLREIKTKEEINLLQKAMDLTIEGFKAMIKQLEPGMAEYEAQAIIEYYSKKGGSEYMGYPSICGGGSNACVLHYTYNRKSLEPKDMFLVDMGAEYHGYTADITRSIPVDGKFSTEEKAIYNLVLQAQNAGIEKCRKGNDFRAAHNAAYAVIAKGLIDLGIIKKESEAKNYFMHGTSHYLGLDVHDAGTYQSLLPGVVMTVEPGIYINQGSNCDPKWWGIGVRIEDDILITDGDPVNMTISLPRSIEDLEKMMAE